MNKSIVALLVACSCGGASKGSSLNLPNDAASSTGGPGTSTAPALAIGPVVTPSGATLTLWAPHAASVSVAGDFSNWAPVALARVDDGGDFSAEIAGATSGQRYQYTLVTTTDAGTVIRADPRALEIDDGGMSVLYDPTAYAFQNTFQPPPFNQQVIYELHIATFNDPSTNTGAGTWQTATAQLAHLSDLSVNMIEVMPIAEFPDTYSWGYDPNFPFAPETNYGSPDDFKAFVDDAHGLGIGVIVDIVHNHWGPNDLPMWIFDGASFGAGGIYFYTDDRQQTGFGPRPDFGRGQIRDYIVENEMMLLSDYNVDGLRWDSTVNIRQAAGQALPDGWGLLQRITDTAHSAQPGKIMIAEDLQNYGEITAPTANGDGGTGFDSQWDPNFFYPIKSAILTAAGGGGGDMSSVASAITHSFNGTATQRVLFTEDHDMVSPQNGPDNLRLPALIDPSDHASYTAQKLSTLAASVALTSPGIPMLFMGQEFLEDLPFPFSQGQAIEWSKATTYEGIDHLYRRLIELRKNQFGNTRGLTGNNTSVYHINNGANVIAYRRWDQGGPGDDVIVLANFGPTAYSNYEVGVPSAGTWNVLFNGDSINYSPLFHNSPSNATVATAAPRDGFEYTASLGVGPYSIVVLSQTPPPPAPPTLGAWTLNSFTGGGSAPQSIYWIQAITLSGATVAATSGTFTGTLGCGLSNCSGFQIPDVSGTWSVDVGSLGPEIQLVSAGQTYAFTYRLTSGSMILSYEGSNDGNPPGTFTLTN